MDEQERLLQANFLEFKRTWPIIWSLLLARQVVGEGGEGDRGAGEGEQGDMEWSVLRE